MIVGPLIATGLVAADLVPVFFATDLLAAFVALAGALFVALVAVLALVVVFAFILKPFLPLGG